jgi:hypothetical protein
MIDRRASHKQPTQNSAFDQPDKRNRLLFEHAQKRSASKSSTLTPGLPSRCSATQLLWGCPAGRWTSIAKSAQSRTGPTGAVGNIQSKMKKASTYLGFQVRLAAQAFLQHARVGQEAPQLLLSYLLNRSCMLSKADKTTQFWAL